MKTIYLSSLIASLFFSGLVLAEEAKTKCEPKVLVIHSDGTPEGLMAEASAATKKYFAEFPVQDHEDDCSSPSIVQIVDQPTQVPLNARLQEGTLGILRYVTSFGTDPRTQVDQPTAGLGVRD